MSQTSLSQFSDASIGDHFAYRSPEDKVVLGFVVRAPEHQTLDALDSSQTSEIVDTILDMTTELAKANGRFSAVDEIDFDLCGQAEVQLNINLETRERMGAGKSFLMLPDFAHCQNTLDTLIAATKAGTPPVIKLDVVADRDGELQCLAFFGELTGDMS